MDRISDGDVALVRSCNNRNRRETRRSPVGVEHIDRPCGNVRGARADGIDSRAAVRLEPHFAVRINSKTAVEDSKRKFCRTPWFRGCRVREWEPLDVLELGHRQTDSHGNQNNQYNNCSHVFHMACPSFMVMD